MTARPGDRALATRAGDFCFRWRSYLPLSLAPLVLVAIARFQYPFGTHAADLAWEAGCVALALAGLALRVWTVGVAAPGTSGRNTRAQKAATLNTTGPYSMVRHPLYLANGVIVVGLALFTHAWVAPAVVAALAIGYYGLIAEREEQYLRERFGQAFEAWAARVPAVVPAPSGYEPAARAFDWRVAVRREFYGLTVILVTPCLLDVVEDLHESGAFTLDPVWTVAAGLGAAAFLAIRFLKKHTRVLDPVAPAPPAVADRRPARGSAPRS